MKLGIDLRCLPVDGSPGGGIPHAARSVTRALLDLDLDLGAARESFGYSDHPDNDRDGSPRILKTHEPRREESETILYLPKGAKFDETRGVRVELADARRSSLMIGLKNNPCDKLFVPSGAVPFGINVPTYPWVHDLEIFDHPEWFPQSTFQRYRTTRMFRTGLRGSEHVFAVSEYTQRETVRLIPALKDRITTTYEGGDEVLELWAESIGSKKAEARSRLASHDLRKPYVLMLGTVEPRKNIEMIVNIWPDIAGTVRGVDLVIAGADGWGLAGIDRAMQICSARLQKYESDLHRLKLVTDDFRRNLLLGATLVLVPSLAEGFGRVALEALEAGTNVLIGDRGAMPEITGPGDWVLNPENQIAWRDATIELLRNPALRDLWRREQSKDLERFTWHRTAEIILSRIA